jgi:predicted aspartyl protease
VNVVRLLMVMGLAAACAVAGLPGRIGSGDTVFGLPRGGLVASRLSAANGELTCTGGYKAPRRASLASAPPQRPTQYAMDEVALKEKGGTFLAPAVINDTVIADFHVDSGSADVSIPRGLFIALVQSGTIQSGDIIGTRLFQFADGRNVPSQTFRIRTLRVGNHQLENVVTSVGGDGGSLLLGQSFLSRFSAWSIDNNRKVLILR